jgi:CheY-like chemotaxis protein
MRILIVDDSTIIRMMLKSLLAQLRLKDVVEAPNGRDALAVLKQGPVDLVFLDLNMPVMDGPAFLRALGGGNGAGLPVPVVVVSSVMDAEQRNEALQLGAKTYVTKPFKMDALKEALAAVCPSAVPPTDA